MNFKEVSEKLKAALIELNDTLPYSFNSTGKVGAGIKNEKIFAPYRLTSYYLGYWYFRRPPSFEYNFNALKKYETPETIKYLRQKIPELMEKCLELSKAARLAAYKEPEWFDEFYRDNYHYKEIYDLDGEDCRHSKMILMELVPEFESFLLAFPENEYRADIEKSIRSIKEFNNRKEERDHDGIMKIYKLIEEIRFKKWIKNPRWDPESSPYEAPYLRIQEYEFKEYAGGSPLSRSFFALSRGNEGVLEDYIRKYSRVFLSFGILLSSYKLKDFAQKYIKEDFSKLAIDPIFQKVIPICLNRLYSCFDFNAMTCLQLLERTEPKLSESCKDERSKDLCQKFLAEINEVYNKLYFTKLTYFYMSYDEYDREGYKIYLENKDNGKITMMGEPGYGD